VLATREDGLLDLRGKQPGAPLPPPRLLGAFEPVLLGWASREPLLGPHAERVAVGGMFRPFALVRGRGVATWSLGDDRIELEPFRRLSREDRVALDADGRDVVRFLGR
jgi:hypothetical protein